MLLIAAIIVAVSCSVAATTSKHSASNIREVQLNKSSAFLHNNSSILEDNITSTLSVTINTIIPSIQGKQANAKKSRSTFISQRW